MALPSAKTQMSLTPNQRPVAFSCAHQPKLSLGRGSRSCVADAALAMPAEVPKSWAQYRLAGSTFADESGVLSAAGSLGVMRDLNARTARVG